MRERPKGAELVRLAALRERRDHFMAPEPFALVIAGPVKERQRIGIGAAKDFLPLDFLPMASPSEPDGSIGPAAHAPR